MVSVTLVCVCVYVYVRFLSSSEEAVPWKKELHSKCEAFLLLYLMTPLIAEFI
jgi:hypothetical protein